MRALRIHEAATDEAAEAAAWYEKERPGLGAEFERSSNCIEMYAEIELQDRARHHRRTGDQPVDGLCNLVGLADAPQRGGRDQTGFSLGERLRGEALDEALLDEDRANGIYPHGWGKHTSKRQGQSVECSF